MKVVPVTIGPVRTSRVPSLDSCASTVTRKISEPNIAEFNITVQVSITLDPIIRMGLTISLVNVTEDGLGTIQRKIIYKIKVHLELDYYSMSILRTYFESLNCGIPL